MMQAEWHRILAWVESRAPDLLDALEPPADRADLAEAERRLSMRLPTALRAFYTLQNGTTAFAVFPALDDDLPAFGPLSLDEIEFFEVEDEDEADKKDAPGRGRSRGGRGSRDRGGDREAGGEDFEADPGVRPEFWNPGWIPFAASADGGDFLMLDVAPARGGHPGQIIEWRNETNERRLVARSLEALLKQTADGLEAGRYVWDDELGVRRAG